MALDHPNAPPVADMIGLLRWRAEHQPDRVGFTFLADGEDDAHDLTYGALDTQARAVAAWLQARGGAQATVMMMFDEGHDYTGALFGCMYAEMLAVPVHPPDPRRLHRTLPRLKNIASDAGVTFVLTTSDIEQATRAAFTDVPELANAQWLSLDQLDMGLADGWVDPQVQPATIAYLQYTSGSTALPKGVMVSHHNLIHQLTDFDTGYDHSPDSVLVTWLPATHDLGLVYGRLMPVFIGFRCVFLSPVAFMQRPFRWLRALSVHKGTHSPSPNFGFELAILKSDPADLASLDLSSVQVVLNGAEPIRESSELHFIDTLAAHGLRKTAVTHAMGMSESTAKILTEPIDRYPPRFVHIHAAAYERNEVVVVPPGTEGARIVASCGHTVLDTEVVIADPETHERLGDGRVGEMWVGGTTVAQGYWNNPEATEATFRARLSTGEGPFLRTGDLAFRRDGEVYLCGRLKDMIIIRGQNHHPQDIEWTIGSAHPALRPNCAAAFSVPDANGSDQLVIVTEVYRHKVDQAEQVFGAIRQAVAEHGLAARTLVLMPPRALPKTSSGKIQRTKARQQFTGDGLETLFRWDAKGPEASTPEPSSAPGLPLLAALSGDSPRRRLQRMIGHICELTAGLLGLDAEDIEPDRPLQELGLDSVTAVEMVERVGKAIGHDIPGTLLFDYPTIEGMSRHILDDLLATEVAAPSSGSAPAASLTPAQVAEMSDADVEQALLDELDDL